MREAADAPSASGQPELLPGLPPSTRAWGTRPTGESNVKTERAAGVAEVARLGLVSRDASRSLTTPSAAAGGALRSSSLAYPSAVRSRQTESGQLMASPW